MTAEARALAAVRFVDQATGQAVAPPVEVSCPLGAWSPNRSGLWVLRTAHGLEEHTRTADEPPPTPAPGSVPITSVVSDPRGRYLPRAFTLALPRAPASRAEVTDVLLPPGPAAPVRPGHAAVRVTVTLGTDAQHPTPVPLEGAVVHLSLSAGNLQRCVTLTDARGQALAIAWGIPRFTPGEDPGEIATAAVAHRLRVLYDPAATDLGTGRRLTPADPTDLWSRRASLPTVIRTPQLAAGGAVHLPIVIPRT